MSASSPLRARLGRLVVAAALLGAGAGRLHAYALLGGSWPSGTIPLQLQLDATAPTNIPLPLRDGAATWNAVAQSAIAEWNNSGALVRSTLSGTINSSTATRGGDRVTNVFFSNSIYDDAFDSRTLAVTLVDFYDDDGLPTVRMREADLIVNKSRVWDSYRGLDQYNPIDLRRVLIHEMGHVLGLDHPDEAVPVQNVSALMNSIMGNLDTVRPDDIAGARYLYGTGLVAPILTRQPASQTVNVSSGTSFTIGVNGADVPPGAVTGLLSYSWYFRANGAANFEKLFTIDTPNLAFGTVQLSDAGSYYLVIMTPDPDKTVTSNVVTLMVNGVSNAPATALANLSNRGKTGGDNTMIVGLVVSGSRPKTILVRAVGPTLGTFNVSGALADPKLRLTKQDGTEIASSGAVWDSGANAAEIRATSARVGAFALPAGSRDAVLLVTVPPGNYTALTTSASGNSGVVLVEAYDADATRDPTSRLSNLSTRGYVGTGDDALIAGFVVDGPGPRTYLIRVAGPTLGTAPFNVTGTLYDPMLKLYSGGVLLRETDDWDSPVATQPSLQAAFDKVQAFPFKDRKECAMLVTLQPGLYSAAASGNENGGSTSPVGNAIIEIYEVP